MSTSTTQQPASQLWGIYHNDQEFARSLGDPLRTTVEAPTKAAAEEAAAKLGFTDARAHLIAPQVVTLARSVLKKFPRHHQALAHTPSRGIRI